MKKNMILILILLWSLILVTGCYNNQENSDVINTPIPEVTDNHIEQTQAIDFSLKLNDTTTITLRELNNVILADTLGKPLSEHTRQLAGDGLTGFFLKKLTYDGLEFELLGPEDDVNTYWMMTMIVTKPGYTTSNGIQVGNTVKDIKQAYPNLHTGDDGKANPNNCQYEVGDRDQSKYIQFEVKDGVVTQLKIFFLIP